MSEKIVEFRTPKVPHDFASLQARMECYQKVWREWGTHLDPNEQIVLLQLIDRTIGWGRREAYFTARAVLEGDSLYSGTKISRSTFYRALARLESVGLVRRRKDARVMDRVHFTVNMDWEPNMLKLPKRLQNGSENTENKSSNPVSQRDYPVSHRHYPVSQGHSIISNNLSVSTISNLAGCPAPLQLSPEDIIREKADRAAAANRAALKAKTQKPQAQTEAVNAAWRLALTETFPGVSYREWTVREKAQIKRALQNWRGKDTFIDFVTWSVTNWTALMRKQFKWMTKSPPPATPSLSFFVNFLPQFAEARADNVLESWLSDDDRTRLERMMGRGQTYDQAMAEMAKNKATLALRSEMEKREIKVRARDYAATRKLKEAKALADLEGRIPVHPRSRAAEEIREEQRKAQAQPTRIIAPDDPEFQGAEVFFVDPTRNPYDD